MIDPNAISFVFDRDFVDGKAMFEGSHIASVKHVGLGLYQIADLDGTTTHATVDSFLVAGIIAADHSRKRANTDDIKFTKINDSYATLGVTESNGSHNSVAVDPDNIGKSLRNILDGYEMDIARITKRAEFVKRALVKYPE